MALGLFSFNTQYSIRPDHFAKAAEERGYDSVWFPEHTHIPAKRITPYPRGGDLPREYINIADPFTSCAAAAAVTENILIGTAISLINQHDPITLAKEVATVDWISNGRFLLGVGAGWNVEEMNNHGVQFEERWPYLWEMLEAMQALWTQEEASYHGKYIQFERAWSYPKPVQRPHPPILLGVYDSKIGRARVARRAQGWLPSSYDLERTERSIADVRQRMKANNRDPDQLTTSILYLSEEPSEDAVLRALQCGADRLILRVPTKNEKSVLKFMDRFQGHTG
ncbi:MAG: LLM class F420-dependent oxidoreductase [Rhodospirillaceae bacterium]|nr:LLM class F420-dependent oxidoreductase [Rhodospirillaceae bacterium]|tara:strand:+ start:3146 stop:3991 length:846 start_codon:yes stop_codon:yes gene_type:complete